MVPIDSWTPPWALVLAGGDGVRLRSLIASLVGTDCPKQFCQLLAGETLLDHTRRRVSMLIPAERQVIVLTRGHDRHYAYLRHEVAGSRLAVQPSNRETAPGILFGLLRVALLAGDVPVAIVPSDHWVSSDSAFMGHVAAAVSLAHERRDVPVLLGIEPSSAETDYGWIEPSRRPLPDTTPAVFVVRRFWEKPSADRARQLFRSGSLWNSFVIVGWLSTLLRLIEATAPDLFHRFGLVCRLLGSAQEPEAVELVYSGLPRASFAEAVLSRAVGALGTLVVSGIDWADLGDPARVLACLDRQDNGHAVAALTQQGRNRLLVR